MSRLKNTFGDKAYPDERVLLLWQEVASLDGLWFRKVIDKFIIYCKTPPLMSEFAPEITQERLRMTREYEDTRREEKEKSVPDVSEEERYHFLQAVKAKMTGRISPKAYQSVFPKIDDYHHCSLEGSIMRASYCANRNCQGTHTVEPREVEDRKDLKTSDSHAARKETTS